MQSNLPWKSWTISCNSQPVKIPTDLWLYLRDMHFFLLQSLRFVFPFSGRYIQVWQVNMQRNIFIYKKIKLLFVLFDILFVWLAWPKIICLYTFDLITYCFLWSFAVRIVDVGAMACHGDEDVSRTRFHRCSNQLKPPINFPLRLQGYFLLILLAITSIFCSHVSTGQSL